MFNTFGGEFAEQQKSTILAPFTLATGINVEDLTGEVPGCRLGESRIGIILRIWLPLLAPYVVLSAGLAATISLTEPLMPLFLGDARDQTIAERTALGIQHGIDQRDTVAATLVVGLVLVAGMIVLIGRMSHRRMAH